MGWDALQSNIIFWVSNMVPSLFTLVYVLLEVRLLMFYNSPKIKNLSLSLTHTHTHTHKHTFSLFKSKFWHHIIVLIEYNVTKIPWFSTSYMNFHSIPSHF